MGPVDAEVVMTSSDLEGARALDFLDELAETLGDVPINPDTANHETELVLATAQVEWLVSGDHIRPSTNGRAAVLLLQSQAEVIRQAGEPVTLFGDSVLRNGPAISQSFAEDSPLSNSSFLYLWSPVLRKVGDTIVEEGSETCMGQALIQNLDDLSAEEMERVGYDASGAGERRSGLVAPVEDTTPVPLVPGGEAVDPDLQLISGALLVDDQRLLRNAPLLVCATGSVLGATACIETTLNLELDGRDTGVPVLLGPLVPGEIVTITAGQEGAQDIALDRAASSLLSTTIEAIPQELGSSVMGEHTWLLRIRDESLDVAPIAARDVDAMLGLGEEK